MTINVTVEDTGIDVTVEDISVVVDVETTPVDEQLVKDIVGIGEDGDIRAIVASRVDTFDNLALAADSFDGEVAVASDSEMLVVYRGDPAVDPIPIATPFNRPRDIAVFAYNDVGIVIPVDGSSIVVKTSESLGDAGGYIDFSDNSFAGGIMKSLIPGSIDMAYGFEISAMIDLAFPSTSATFIKLSLEMFSFAWNEIAYTALPVIAAAGTEYRFQFNGLLPSNDNTRKFRLALSSNDTVIMISEVEVLVKYVSYARDGYIPVKNIVA